MLEILYKDEHLCVINKPPNYVVHKTRGAGSSPVILQHLRDQIEQHVYPVHRLDRATSGCLAFALSSFDAQKLQVSLSSMAAVKIYTCLCKGKTLEEGSIDRDLTSEKGVKQSALTKYRLVKQSDLYSLLEVQIFTGRRHQIRRHLAHLGHQIVGDVNYGKGWLNRRFRDEYEFHRMFLHCHRLEFDHPINGGRIVTKCDLDNQLKHLVERLDLVDSC